MGSIWCTSSGRSKIKDIPLEGDELATVATELSVYPREPHGVTERAHLVDMTTKTLAWLDRWLPAEGGARAKL